MVEDDSFFSAIYARALEADGFDVDVALSAEEGLKQVVKNPPHLILLDLRLHASGMDGFEFLEHVRNDPSSSAIPVLILTNLGQREDVERAKELGAAGYLIKAHTMPAQAVAEIKSHLHAIV